MEEKLSKDELSELSTISLKDADDPTVYAQKKCINSAAGCGGGTDQEECSNTVSFCGVVMPHFQCASGCGSRPDDTCLIP